VRAHDADDPALAGAVPLTRNVARKPAFEMLVTGEFISADEARARGLVNRVASMEALDGAVESLVAAIVAKPRSAIALGKALFYRQIERGAEAAYEDAARTMACNMMEADTLEGGPGLHRQAQARLAELAPAGACTHRFIARLDWRRPSVRSDERHRARRQGQIRLRVRP
jgi:enoyl-CoA hydratase/carnithine racemase